MKILRLEIEGYRSLRSQVWTPGDLNVLIGPNASGKTNLLRVLETLSAAATGRLGRFVQQEGGIEPMLWDGRADAIRISAKTTSFPPYDAPETDALTYKLELRRLGVSSAHRIEYEVLGNFCGVERGVEQQPYKLLERNLRHAVVFSMKNQRFQTIPTTTTPPIPYSAAMEPIEATEASLPEDESLLSFAAGPFAANHFVAEFQRELAAWKIYEGFSTHRDAPLRSPQVTRTETHVNPDGQNLIPVLHSLYYTSRDFRREADEAMRAAFGDDFEGLSFPPAADQRIQMRVQWKGLERGQPAADLSDGTLRFLFLVAVLANPSPPPLIAIDEPETGLHPSMLPIVAEYAREAARRCQVVLATHSPEFLDAFRDEAPTATVVERRDGETVLRTISGEDLSYWLKQYTLGELYRSRELEAMT
jgi:predicted ATPase